MIDLEIYVISYKETHRIIDNLKVYQKLSNIFALSFSFNLDSSDLKDSLKGIRENFQALSSSSSNIYLRLGESSIILESENDIDTMLHNSKSDHQPLSFGDHIRCISSESNATYTWILGAGDYPNAQAIGILNSIEQEFDILSFEVLRAARDKISSVSNQLLPRRVESISCSIYKRAILQNSNVDNWPHVQAVSLIRKKGVHLLVAYADTGCGIFVDPDIQWRSQWKKIALERIDLFLASQDNPNILWEWTFGDIVDAQNLLLNEPDTDRLKSFQDGLVNAKITRDTNNLIQM
jgi:hypothetical protein